MAIFAIRSFTKTGKMLMTRYVLNLFTLLCILKIAVKASGPQEAWRSCPWGMVQTSLPRGGASDPSTSRSPPSVESRPKKKRRKRKHHTDSSPSRDKSPELTSNVRPTKGANSDPSKRAPSDDPTSQPGNGSSDAYQKDETKSSISDDTEKVKNRRRKKHRETGKKRKHVKKEVETSSNETIEIKSDPSVPRKKKKVKKRRSLKPLKVDAYGESMESNTTNIHDISDSVKIEKPISSLSKSVDDQQNTSPKSTVLQNDSGIIDRKEETDDADHLGLGLDHSTSSDSESLHKQVGESIVDDGVVSNHDSSKPTAAIITSMPTLEHLQSRSNNETRRNFTISEDALREGNAITKGNGFTGDVDVGEGEDQATLNKENLVTANSSACEIEVNDLGNVMDTADDDSNSTTDDDGKDGNYTEAKQVTENEDSSETSDESSIDNDQEEENHLAIDRSNTFRTYRSDEANGIGLELAPDLKNTTSSRVQKDNDADSTKFSDTVSSVIVSTNTSSSSNVTVASTDTINEMSGRALCESSVADSQESVVNRTRGISPVKGLSRPTDANTPPLSVNLQKLAEEKDSQDDLHVSIVTWNLAEESPEEDDTQFIRSFRNHGIDKKGSDFVLIAGQECENIKPRRTEGRRSREFRRIMVKQLGKRYVPIAIHQLGGIQFGLFCRRSILHDIESVSVADVTCGIGNVFHNKGAIAAFVQLRARNKNTEHQRKAKSLKMLFVTAHMAAHVKNFEARDADYWRIMTELEAHAPTSFVEPFHNGENSGRAKLVDAADRVFFCGDLNYRMDLPREVAEHTVHQIKEHTKRGNENDRWLAKKLRSKLLIYDQLLCTMAAGRAFQGLVEGEITFLPTFKYDKHSDDFDTSHKQRIPAWTDRILFKPTGTRVLEYDSYVDAKHSDHRPVFATFRVNAEGRPQQQTKSKRKKRSSTKKPIEKGSNGIE